MTGDVGAKDGCGGGARARFGAGCFTHDRTLARQRVWAYTIASPAADGWWQHDKTVWPCQQRRMHWKGERGKRQRHGSPPAPESWAPACKLFPSPAAARGLCTSSSSYMLPWKSAVVFVHYEGLYVCHSSHSPGLWALGVHSVSIQFSLQPQGLEHHFILITSHENWDHPLISGLGEWDLKQPSKCHEAREWITNTNSSCHRSGHKIQIAICTISLLLFRSRLSSKVTAKLSP